MNESDTRSTAPQGGLFPPTRWTRVSELRRDPASDEGRKALAELCQTYWYPIYAFARRKGQPPADAQDLVQGFFAKMLGSNSFADASAAAGRMRSYLLTLFTRHMADEWDKAQARKRGGGIEILSLDFDDGEQRYLHEPACDGVHESVFDRAWAQSVIEQAGAALEAECAQQGKAGVFEHVSPLITGSGEASAYEDLAARTGMTAEALRQFVRRLRLRFRDLLRQTISDTLENPDDSAVDDELRSLRAALSR